MPAMTDSQRVEFVREQLGDLSDPESLNRYTALIEAIDLSYAYQDVSDPDPWSGRLFLFGRIVLYANGKTENCELVPVPREPVVSATAYWQIYGNGGSLSTFYSPSLLPSSTDRCSICGKPFCLADIKGNAFTNARKDWLHKKCMQHVYDVEETQFFKDIFEKAGFPVTYIKPIPNQYHNQKPEGDPMTPWVEVGTRFGVIIAGSRKRVYSFSWQNFIEGWPYERSKLMDKNFVTSDDVTKDQTLVHAWSQDDAVKYMRTLYEKMRVLA